MGKRPKHDFTTGEQRILREHYPTHTPVEEIAKLMPNHSIDAIKQHATKTLKLKRPVWSGRQSPGWDRVRDLLKVEKLTEQEVADHLEISKARAHQLMSLHRGELHIVDWQPPADRGRWSAVWAYGKQPDEPQPFKRWTAAAIAQRAANPFATAAGLVQPPVSAPVGRIYQQSMSIMDEEQEAA
jgi:hypothetical protein